MALKKQLLTLKKYSMPDFQLQTPVAFIVFNRPQTTAKVFTAIADAKPPVLLVIADGPRDRMLGEQEQCIEVRKIFERINWDCQVLTNFSEINLGCKQRVSSGIDWVFEHVNEAIFLEDDCLPEPTFFRFCEEMLVRYRDDERIGMISGDNFQFGRKYWGTSYYFSRYSHIWGWATWRRAWQKYDVQMNSWPEFRDQSGLDTVFCKKIDKNYWENILQAVYDQKIDTWDYQWAFTNWSENRLSIIPNVNLISNIGFGPNATHTLETTMFANLKTGPMAFPLAHPSYIVPNVLADKYTSKKMFRNTSVKNKIHQILRKFLA